MAFWYCGKPDKELYRNISGHHFLVNLVNTANSYLGESDYHNIRLQTAANMYELMSGCNVDFTYEKINGFRIVRYMKIHDRYTDEVLKTEFIIDKSKYRQLKGV